jgi:hypothetical protein
MNKSYMLSFLLMFSAAGLIMGGFGHTEENKTTASETITIPKEIILLYPVGSVASTMSALKKYTHEEHAKDYEVACRVCHHAYVDGKNVWQKGMPVKKCEECHDESAAKGKKELIPGLLLKKQILTLRVCKNCHTRRSG